MERRTYVNFHHRGRELARGREVVGGVWERWRWMNKKKRTTEEENFHLFYSIFYPLAASSNFSPALHSPQPRRHRRPQHCYLLCPLCAYMFTYAPRRVCMPGRNNSRKKVRTSRRLKKRCEKVFWQTEIVSVFGRDGFSVTRGILFAPRPNAPVKSLFSCTREHPLGPFNVYFNEICTGEEGRTKKEEIKLRKKSH